MDNLQVIQGVGACTAEKLHQMGYESYAQIASATAAELSEKVGISLTTAEQIIESAQTILSQARSTASEEATVERTGTEATEADEVESAHLESEETDEEGVEEAGEDEPNRFIWEPGDLVYDEEGVEEADEDELIECEEEEEDAEFRELAHRFVEVILQDADAAKQISRSVRAELNQILGKKLRKKLKKKVSQKKFRKALIAGLVKGLEKIWKYEFFT